MGITALTTDDLFLIRAAARGHLVEADGQCRIRGQLVYSPHTLDRLNRLLDAGFLTVGDTRRGDGFVVEATGKGQEALG